MTWMRVDLLSAQVQSFETVLIQVRAKVYRFWADLTCFLFKDSLKIPSGHRVHLPAVIALNSLKFPEVEDAIQV